MKSFRNQLRAIFTVRSEETRLLDKVCRKIGLSKTQKEHLRTRVFFDSNALAYWVEMHHNDASKAERYLVKMAPPREARPKSMFDLWWLKWLAPVARATGLLS